MTAFAAPAIAALMLTGAGPANAAVTTAATPHAIPAFGYCSPYNLERWDFRGDNTIHATWEGFNYTYTVRFDQRGSCLSGWLNDPNIPNGPTTAPIRNGFVFRNRVTFTYTYTYSGETQGTRVYTGTISPWGGVSGTWYDTGSDHSTGTWSLERPVRRACPDFYPWFGFFQYGNGCPVPFPYRFYY